MYRLKVAFDFSSLFDQAAETLNRKTIEENGHYFFNYFECAHIFSNLPNIKT